MPKKLLDGKIVYHTAGVPKRRYTPEEIIDLSTKICALYATGNYTVEKCCRKYHVAHHTFLAWAAPNTDVQQMLIDREPLPKKCVPEVHELYKHAKAQYLRGYVDLVKDKARNSLLKRIEGYETTEVNDEYELDKTMFDNKGKPNPTFGQMVLIKQRVKTKTEAPSDTAIMFALTNVDPETFKRASSLNTEPPVKPIEASKEVAKLGDDELARLKLDLKRKLSRAETQDIEYEDVSDINRR